VTLMTFVKQSSSRRIGSRIVVVINREGGHQSVVTSLTLYGRMPRYLSGDCQLISVASRRLRSSDTFTFAVPRTRTRLGVRSFAHRYGTVCRQICA